MNPEDAGTYAVEVQNEKKSRSLARLLHKTEAKFLSSIKPLQVNPGAAFFLQCDVEPESAEVCWYKNDEKIEEDDGLKIINDGILRRIEFERFSESDQGTYFVKILESNSLYVNEPLRIATVSPVVENHSDNQTSRNSEEPVFGIRDLSVKEGDNAVIGCNLKEPAEELFWYRGESGENTWPCESLVESEKFQFKSSDDKLSHQLTIIGCTGSDEGNYFVKIGSSGKSYQVYSGCLTVTCQKAKAKSILKVIYLVNVPI